MTLSDPQFSSSSLRDSPFVRNLWYVAAWSHEVGAGGPVGRFVIKKVGNRRGDHLFQILRRLGHSPGCGEFAHAADNPPCA